MHDERRVLLYGDIDLRYTDGSAIWLISIARALTSTGSRVSLLLKSTRGTGGLFDDLASIEGLEVIDDFKMKSAPAVRHLPSTAARRIDELVTERAIDIVICRGFEVCREVVKQPNAGLRLWAYMTNIPQTAAEMTDVAVIELTKIASTAQRLFAQTEEARDFLEYHVPAARRKTLLLPPMLPDALEQFPRKSDCSPLGESTDVVSTSQPLRLVYAGKFARQWNTLEMCDLPRQAANVGVDIELTMIGDKFQSDLEDESWASRMQEAIRTAPGVHWLGSLSRADTLHEVARHDIGMAWRSTELDSSHEISTKLLEYLACGVPPIVNRNVMHESLLGEDYALYVDGNDVLSALQRATYLGDDLKHLRTAAHAAVEPYGLSTRSVLLEAELARAESEDVNLTQPLNVDILADDSNSEMIEATLGSCQGVLTRRLSKPATRSTASPDSLLVTDVQSHSRLRDCRRPLWILWDDSARDAQRPIASHVAGVFIRQSSSRREAAWWAKVPVSRVFVLPDVVDPTAARRKAPAAPYTVGVIVGPDDMWAAREAHQLLTLLRAEEPRFSLRLFLPANDALASRPLERELLLDALTDLAVDSMTANAWSLATTSGSATWLREVGWLTESRTGLWSRYLGGSIELSRTVLLPQLSATRPVETTLRAREILRTDCTTPLNPPAPDTGNNNGRNFNELKRALALPAS